MTSGSLKRLLIWVLLISLWEMAYRFIGWDAWKFPAPSHVLDALLYLSNIKMGFSEPLGARWPRLAGDVFIGKVWNSELALGILVSGIRLIIGFVLSIVIGGILGALMWRFKSLDEFLGPLFLGLQTLPSVCWVPIAYQVYGIKEKGVMFVLVIGSCLSIAIALRDGLRVIPPVYQRAGLMMGAKGWRLYRYVLFPASLPALTSSLRQGFSFAWRSLMGAEFVMFAVKNHGVGYLLEMGRNYSDVAQVIGVMFLMVALGMLADRFAFSVLEKAVHRRFGLETAK